MILDNSTQEKPEINYPTQWGFKLIGKDKDNLLECIKEVMGDKKHNCKIGNISKGGKFCSYNADCIVDSEDERNKIFKEFEKHNAVKMVI